MMLVVVAVLVTVVHGSMDGLVVQVDERLSTHQCNRTLENLQVR